MKQRKIPTCEMSKLAIDTTSIAIKTIANKGYVMKINPQHVKSQTLKQKPQQLQQKSQQVGAMQWRKTPTCENLDLVTKTTTIVTKTTTTVSRSCVFQLMMISSRHDFKIQRLLKQNA